MAEDISSTSSNTIPFPTLTIVYLVNQAEQLIDEISQKYNNITVEDCNGFFNDGVKRDYKKITIWSQGIDSLWFNALIARIKEIAKYGLGSYSIGRNNVLCVALVSCNHPYSQLQYHNMLQKRKYLVSRMNIRLNFAWNLV